MHSIITTDVTQMLNCCNVEEIFVSMCIQVVLSESSQYLMDMALVFFFGVRIDVTDWLLEVCCQTC